MCQGSKSKFQWEISETQQQRHSRTALCSLSRRIHVGFCTNCGLKSQGALVYSNPQLHLSHLFFFPHTALHIVGQEVNVFQYISLENHQTMEQWGLYPPDFFLRRKRDLGFPHPQRWLSRVIEDLVDFTVLYPLANTKLIPLSGVSLFS